MSIFNDLFHKIWDMIKPFLHDEVEPAVKAFWHQFASEEGRLILSTAIAAAPGLVSGSFGTVAKEVMETVIRESKVIAAQEIAKTLQQVQSALQIAKVAENIVTPGDQVIVDSTPPAPSPQVA